MQKGVCGIQTSTYLTKAHDLHRCCMNIGLKWSQIHRKEEITLQNAAFLLLRRKYSVRIVQFWQFFQIAQLVSQREKMHAEENFSSIRG